MAAQGMSRGKVDFTRDGIEQLQKDVIAFLDQFDEMPQEDPQGAGGPVEISPENLMGNLSELEGLISDLKMEMGGGDEEVIPGEEEEEIEGELQ